MPASTSIQRKVSFFRNGRNQAVRIPKEFEVSVKTGRMIRDGSRLIIETAPDEMSLKQWLDSLDPIDIEWPEIEDQPPEPVNL
jgi:antitoxin VapB